ncbi:MAG: chloride channel protein [Vicinamibacterales bacterium]
MSRTKVPLTPQQLRLRENQIFLALAIVVGVLAGLSAVLFSLAISGTTRAFFGLQPSWMRLLLIPPAVSVITGVLLYKFFPDVRGSGVPQTEAAFHLNDGVIPPSVPIGKFLTGVLCIGSGHSMGREGPSVQIGAGIASGIGQWLRLSPERVKELVPVGAAGALSAAFNTPVAAVVFALEEIIGDMNATLLGSTVVASVASVIVARSILGNEPLFHVPVYQLVHPAELAAYAALGVVGGLVSLGFSRGLLQLRAVFRGLPAASQVVHPAMGGLALGALLLVVPEVMGVGYDSVDQALNGGMLAGTMAVLLAAKLVGTTISYASGNAGGIFAPSLYIGAMVGGIVGTAVHWLAPFPTGDTGAYALVGMGALFAGIIRAPMTSVFMIFEITQDYQILVPLMVANLIAYWISRRYQPTPVYHALLQQDGVHLPSAEAKMQGPGRTARDLLDTGLPIVDANTTLEQAWGLLDASGASAVLVTGSDGLNGVVARYQLEAARETGAWTGAIGPLAGDVGLHAHPDQPIDVVLERLAEAHGVLPIVSRSDIRRVVGAVTADSILRASRRKPDQAAPGG